MKWIKYLFSWEALAIWDICLIATCWPWANHFISYGWILITIAVLIWEIGCKFFSNMKKTASDIIRIQRTVDTVRFWFCIFFWVGFSLTLAAHFCVRGV